ncbi:MAG: hypothetical protein SH857_05895 [Chitinophagales bacterium]|nr:hypothetical protein [Chitinophagales bacterium]
MQEHHLTIPKTARYYSLGEISKDTNTVWLVCHGYAQLAGEFIKEFESLAANDVLIIAPEALSKFYTKGFFGTVGATWMTKEDRLNEIKDYINYLNTLFLKIKSEVSPTAQTHILGFSQGCSTICRWIAEKNPAYAALWLCSGSIPDDLDFAKFKNAIEKSPAHYLLGNADPFIGEKDVLAFEERIKGHQLPLQVHRFTGEHVLNLQLIQSLVGK